VALFWYIKTGKTEQSKAKQSGKEQNRLRAERPDNEKPREPSGTVRTTWQC